MSSPKNIFRYYDNKFWFRCLKNPQVEFLNKFDEFLKMFGLHFKFVKYDIKFKLATPKTPKYQIES